MRKFLILSAAAVALILVAVSLPADAASRKAQGVTVGQAVQIDLSARRRYHRRYVYRYYRPRYRYYARPYYYYYGYPYYYGPRYHRYYYPYRFYYYRRPGFYFGFSF